ncbi:AMP-binding protein [Haloechinothrix sp. YIM 98757]|uniref:AMP-binding protein n=1 Tax=Haloechinothrix aidingensis TaxID=2752311 RepID=A0A838AC14_9PSEU|nr:AMP-binding protein [Haloechinothrix aidingensis]MBA0126786.1 AMP-binding protein [Haloechinothrix aidingensis]
MVNETTVPRIIADTAERDPGRVLIQDIEGSDHSYADFHTEALRWCDAFAAAGVRRDSLVATMLPTSVTSYHCWIGLSWLRAPEVPINTQYRGSILAYTLNNSEAEVFVVSAEFVDRLAPIADSLQFLKTIVLVGSVSDLPSLPWRVMSVEEFLADAKPVAHETPEYFDAHAVIYTSGTTGPSKGVLQPWGNIQQVPWAAFPGEQPDAHDDGGVFTCWPTFHSSGKYGLCHAAQLGLRMVLRSSFQLDQFWDDIRRYRVTHAMLLVVSGRLLNEPEKPDDSDNPLARVGMYPLIPQYREFERRFGVRVSAGFGNTEVGFVTATDNPVNHRTNGKPLPGYQVRIVNEHDEELPPDTLGEIVVRHDKPWRLNNGYLRKPEATAEAWRNGWFHTGDAGTFDEDDNLYFVDRFKDCLRHRGHNVSSVEVETEVVTHPDVVECACVGVPSDYADESDALPDQDVKIFVVTKQDTQVTAKEIFDYLVPRLPKFMVPRYIELVDELPKTPTGKTRKVELRSNAVVGPTTWDRKAEGVTLT